MTPLVRRRPLWQRAGMAAAAVVVVGTVGSTLTGTSPGELTALITRQDHSDSSAASADSAGSPESDGSAGGDAGSPGVLPQGLGQAPVQASGTAYVSATFAGQAAATVRQWMTGKRLTESDNAEGEGTSLRSSGGIADCLKGLGVPAEELVGLDLGTLDGRAAAVVVVRSSTDPADTLAYAVDPDCTADSPDVLLGPLALP